MAITQRFIRLFQADLHGVLDRLEEPDILLRQAVREMEEELERAESERKRLTRSRDVLARRREELLAAETRAGQELGLCLDTGNDDLARTTLKRKLESQKLGKHVARQQQELEITLQERQAQLEENRRHYEGIRQKAELLRAQSQASPADSEGYDSWPRQDFCVRGEELEIALLEEKQRRALQGGEAP